MKLHVPRSPWIRIGAIAAVAAIVGVLLWWRGPDWDAIPDAFQAVRWEWSPPPSRSICSRSSRQLRQTINQAMPPPRPRFPLVFSAFCVACSRTRCCRDGSASSRGSRCSRASRLRRTGGGRLGGTAFAHRVFDIVPALLLIGYVLATADIPGWALTSLIAVVSVGSILFLLAFVSAWRHHRSVLEEAGTLGDRDDGAVRPRRDARAAAAIGAIFFQCLGWLCQFFAVYTAMLGFDIHVPLPAAGLVLVADEPGDDLPALAGNVGLTQAAIALLLVRYGVPYAKGFAFGIGLQLIEASVGVGVGLFFLGREGLSFAMLRRMPEMTEAEFPEPENGSPSERARDRSRVSG